MWSFQVISIFYNNLDHRCTSSDTSLSVVVLIYNFNSGLDAGDRVALDERFRHTDAPPRQYDKEDRRFILKGNLKWKMILHHIEFNFYDRYSCSPKSKQILIQIKVHTSLRWKYWIVWHNKEDTKWFTHLNNMEYQWKRELWMISKSFFVPRK